MQVSVEVKEGLERELTVEFPKSDIDGVVKTRLQSLTKTAKINGFRPGKIPLAVIRKRYSAQVEAEALNEKLQQSYYEAISQEKVNPAGQPTIDLIDTDDKENILPGISPESYNLIGYWENEKLSFRLAYNYRDEYVLAGGGSFIGFEDRYVAARGQLDFSAIWRVTDKLQFIARGYNLTEEIYEEYLANNPAKVRRVNWDGRSWALYAQYTF